MSKKIDYLTTDPEIPGQRWVCLSFFLSKYLLLKHSEGKDKPIADAVVHAAMGWDSGMSNAESLAYRLKTLTSMGKYREQRLMHLRILGYSPLAPASAIDEAFWSQYLPASGVMDLCASFDGRDPALPMPPHRFQGACFDAKESVIDTTSALAARATSPTCYHPDPAAVRASNASSGPVFGRAADHDHGLGRRS